MNAITNSRVNSPGRASWADDCLAAGRLLWARWATVLVALWLCSAFGLVLTAVVAAFLDGGQWGRQFREGILGMSLSLTQAPLLLYSIFAIDWLGGNANARASGFDVFLLRSPIPSSRLLFVVVLARMVAIAISLAMISIGVWLMTKSPNSIEWAIYPALLVSLSTTSIAVLAFYWRPVSWVGFRILTLLVLFPVGYAVMFAPFATASGDFPSWLAIGCLPWPVALLWVGVLWVTYRSLELARCHSYGMSSAAGSWVGRVRETISRFVAWLPVPKGELTRQRTAAALAWFDARQTRATRWASIGWVGVPTLVLLLLIELNGAAVVLAGVMVLTYVAMATAGGWGELQGMNHRSQGRALPLLLAVSPVSRETLAGVKIWRSLWLTLSASGIVWGAMALISVPLNRSAWDAWSRTMLIGDSISGMEMGVRISLVIGLATTVLLAGRGLAMLWLALMADRRVTFAVVLLFSAVMMVGFGRGGAWFFTQTDWETMVQSVRAFPARGPGFMAVLLWGKLAAVLISLAIAVRQPGRPVAWIAKTTLGWGVAVLVSSTVLIGLLPDQVQISPTLGVWTPHTVHVGMAVVLALPLSRLLILPWALGRDIHR